MLRDGVPVQSRVAKYDFVASYYGYFLSAFDFFTVYGRSVGAVFCPPG